MALAGYPFPYDINNLLAGAVRILYAPTSVAIPGNIADVVDMESPYSAQTGWIDLGATKDSFTYTRGFDTEGLEIQQVAGNVLEEITDITRTLEVSMAELNPTTLAIMEGADPADVSTIAAATGKSQQKRIKYGSFSSLERYRFAFIARRSKQSGVVTESDATTTRGRFVMGVANQAQLSADDADLEFDKGNLTAAGVTWTMFPDSTVVLSEEAWGAWYDEQSGTIT